VEIEAADVSDPFLAVNVGNRKDGAMFFYLYDKNAKNSYSQSIKNIPEGQWFRVDAFYKCSGEKTGHVTFWQDSTQILDVANVQTINSARVGISKILNGA